jgi:phage shock protein A
MNLLERVLTLLGANLNTVVEKADDPERVLRQLQIDMRNQLVQVKTQVATAIAESHKLQRRSQERKEEADKWLKKAELAVQQGNDNTAREALTHYNDINRQLQRYQQQRENQEQLVGTMRNALRQLEAKIAEVDTTLDLLATRKRNALIQQRVYEALNKSASVREREQTTKAQDALLDAEAHAQALTHLQKHTFDAQIDQLNAEQEIEHQIQAIKEKNTLPPQSLRANEERRQTSPLTFSPQPLEKTNLPHQPRLRKAETQTGPTTSEDLDIEQLKESLNTRKTPGS